MQVPPGTRLSMGILLLGFLAVSAAISELTRFGTCIADTAGAARRARANRRKTL